MKKLLLLAAVAALTMNVALCGQSITVTSPHAGDTWCLGSTHTITWTKSGTMPATVKIRLRRAGAPETEAAVVNITDSTANDGSLSWPIPASVPVGDYFIRVRTNSPSVIGDSGTFHINSCTASITVTSPTAGAEWCVGTSHTITWTKSGAMAATVKIRLRRAGAPESELAVVNITDSTANDGSLSWPIPASVPAGDYFIRVRTTSSPNVIGDSPVFEIMNCAAASITITKPNSKINWCIGQTYYITWNKAGNMNNLVNISLYDSTATTELKRIVVNTGNDGSRIWQVPTDVSPGNYVIKIETIDHKVYSFSEVFKISRCSNLKPDFELLGIPVNGDPTDNNLNYLSVIIKNNGDSYEGAISFRIIGMDRLMGGKFLLDTRKTFNMKLTKGEEVTKRILQGISWPIDVCNVSFGIVVDPDNLITESNETNNSFERTIYKGEVLGKKYCDIRILPKIIKIGKASLRPVPDGGSIVLAHDRNDIFLTLRNNCSETKTLDFSIVYDWTSLFKDGENKVIWKSKITLKPCEVKPLRFTGLEIPKKKEFKTLVLRSLHYFGSQGGYDILYKIRVRVDY